jgi:hypothetical protein
LWGYDDEMALLLILSRAGTAHLQNYLDFKFHGFKMTAGIADEF